MEKVSTNGQPGFLKRQPSQDQQRACICNHPAGSLFTDRMALSVAELFNAVQTRDRTGAGRKTGPVVIIMGAGHTEYGLGVMDRVRHLQPRAAQTNLAITEIAREPADIRHYLAPLDLDGFDPVPPGDYLWFTQRVSYEDPCEKFKTVLKKMKKRQSATKGSGPP